MILPVARVAVAAMAASLAFNTGRNVYETVQISRHCTTKRDAPVLDDSDGRTNLLSSSSCISEALIPTSIDELESMSRKQIMQLYINHCMAPSDLSVLEGEWHGKLLNNNGLVRTTLMLLLKYRLPVYPRCHCSVGSPLAYVVLP
jgi:hypothetical protein